MLRADKGNALAAHAISHALVSLETEQFVSIVDKQVKSEQENLTETPNARSAA